MGGDIKSMILQYLEYMTISFFYWNNTDYNGFC